jgi:uncharacterized protein involved in exopolysaccharide biosynthesis
MEMTEHMQLPRNEVSLRYVAQLLWERRWFVVITTTLCALAATGTALILTKQYTATTVMSAATSLNMQTGGGLNSSVGSLASLVGLSMPGDQKKFESLAVLQSDALTEQYIKAQNLLPVLYYKKWDTKSASWKVTDKDKIPTLWKANEFFKKRIRSVSTDAKTGIVTLKITWKDPILAARWANDLVALTNQFLRDQAISETDRNIAYLNDLMSKTDLLGAKQVIYALLQSEVNRQMVARSGKAYAFNVIDPAQPPETPSFPDRIIWIVGGVIAGAVISLMAVVSRANWIRDRQVH